MVASIVSLGIDPVDMPHTSRYVGIRRLNEKMIMIWHQTIGGNAQIPQFCALFEKVNKPLAVPIILEDALISPAMVHNMIPRTRILDSQGSRHVWIYRTGWEQESRADLTPFYSGGISHLPNSIASNSTRSLDTHNTARKPSVK